MYTLYLDISNSFSSCCCKNLHEDVSPSNTHIRLKLCTIQDLSKEKNTMAEARLPVPPQLVKQLTKVSNLIPKLFLLKEHARVPVFQI